MLCIVIVKSSLAEAQNLGTKIISGQLLSQCSKFPVVIVQSVVDIQID